MSALAFPAFPRVSLPDLNGTVRPVLEPPPGAWMLVAMGHSDCGTTRLVIPYLKRMHTRRGPGTALVLVLQDAAAAARALLSEVGGVGLPVLLEADPYPLSRELGLTTVPTLMLVSPAGVIERASEGFERAAIETIAGRLGAEAPFFLPGDTAPALRPG